MAMRDNTIPVAVQFDAYRRGSSFRMDGAIHLPAHGSPQQFTITSPCSPISGAPSLVPRDVENFVILLVC